MIDGELARQICCVVSRVVELCKVKARGSLTIHFDGSGYLGKQFDESLKSWRDRYSREKVGNQLDEEEFVRVLQRAKL